MDIKRVGKCWRIELDTQMMQYEEWKEIRTWCKENTETFDISSSGYIDFANEEDAMIYYLRFV